MSENIVLQVARHPLQSTGVSEETYECEKCGETVGVGQWPFCPHGAGSGIVKHEYPFTTKAFTGKEIEVTSAAHEKALCQAHGMTKRDDAAWLEKEYVGYNRRTGKHEYKEGRGVGLPGCWV